VSEIRIKFNDTYDDLWCVECKHRINLGEKYAEIYEEVLGQVEIKTYHIDCIPTEEEDLIVDETEE
jgi:hypothetical protein